MATTELTLGLRDNAQPPDDESVPCDSCPHPTAVHDRVAQRYCEATMRAALTRRCICRGDMIDVEQEATSRHRFP
jgi:hypothetical protein